MADKQLLGSQQSLGKSGIPSPANSAGNGTMQISTASVMPLGNTPVKSPTHSAGMGKIQSFGATVPLATSKTHGWGSVSMDGLSMSPLATSIKSGRKK